VLHACNPSTQEAKARGSQVEGQPGLHSETLRGRQEGMEGWREGGREGGILIHIIIWVNLEDTTLSKARQSQKKIYSMIQFI
jgi:hypothetical protein